MLRFIKKLDYLNLYICFFPFAVIFRSFILNSYIILASLIFIFFYLQKKIKINKYYKTIIKYFFLFFLYIFILSFFSIEPIIALKSSFSQIRFILFSLFIIFFLKEIKINLIFRTYLIILVLISLDGLIQFMFGANLFGLNVSNYTSYYRVSGIFGDELILGAFLTYLGIPVLGYYYSNFSNLNNKKKILLIIVSFILWFVIFISGERINFLVFSLFIALLLFYFLNIKRTIIVITIGILIFSGFVSYHEKLNEKYSHFKNIIVNFEDSSYGYIYTRTLSVWLDRPIFGTGLKNYRYNCDKKYPYDEKVHKHPTCQTHPHNFILEMLTETGVIGTILFSIFFISALNINVFHIKKFYNRKFLTMYSSLFVLMIYFFPIKSSGSFFSTFNASLFWFNFSIFIFYVNKYFIKNK